MKGNKTLLILSTVLLIAVVASLLNLRLAAIVRASPGEDEWPMFRYDATRSGYSNSTAPDTNNTIWTYATNGQVYSSPAVADGKVYVGSYDYNIYCLNASSGAKIWNFSTDGSVDSSPAFSDGKIYIGWGSSVLCLDASTGTPVWNYSTNGYVYSSPAVSGGKVYVGSMDHNLYCLNASDGTNIWTSQTTGFILSSPAVADDRVFIGSSPGPDPPGGSTAHAPAVSGNIICLNASTGSTIWTQQTTLSAYMWSSPAIEGDRVYIGGDQVFCLDASNGTLVWGYPVYSASSPAVYGGRVYVGTDDNNTRCIDASNGTSIWNYTTAGAVRSSPAVADGKVYIGSDQLYCLDALNGTKIWSYSTTGGSPAIAYGRLYFGSSDYRVYAFQDVHTLTITTGSDGETNPASGTYEYNEGTIVTATATPYTGYVFDHWEFDGSSNSSNPIDVTMNTSHTLNVVFSWIGTCSLNITATEGGTTDPGPGTYLYTNGTSTNVTALSNEGFNFGHWELDGFDVGSQNPITVTMDSGHLLNAVFTYSVTIDSYCYKDETNADVSIIMDDSPTGYTTPQVFNITGIHNFTLPYADPNGHFLKQWDTNETSMTITVASAGTYTAYYQARYNLTIATTTGGTTDPPPGYYSYWNGTTVDVTENAASGFGLDHWELDNENIDAPNPATIVMDMNHNLNAIFKPLYVLEITPTEGGTTDPLMGNYTYIEGTVVTVNATPSADYGFDHWELDGYYNSTNPIDVTMDSNHTLYAVFNYNVTISAYCLNEDAYINVGITMDGLPTIYTTTHTFTVTGTHNFTLPDTDSTGHFFKQWNTSETSATVVITSPETCTAYYQIKYGLTITATAGGMTSPAPDNYTYWDGTEVNVSAVPSLGYVLDHWELDTLNVGNSTTTTVTMNANHTLNAVFSWTGICDLTITTTTGGTAYPAPGTYEYTNGTEVNVWAINDQGYGFHHWELDGFESGSQNPTKVIMDQNHTSNAVFKEVFTLTITGTAGGTTDPSSGSYEHWNGSLVIASATPYAYYGFDHWELDGSWNATNPIDVTMNSNHTLYAVFNYNVTISAYCLNEDALVSVYVTIDGEPTNCTTTHTFTVLGGTHIFTVQSKDPKMHSFKSWDLYGQSGVNLTVTSPGSHVAVYFSIPSQVGGERFPIDLVGILAPYIGSILIALIPTIAVASSSRRRKRRKESVTNKI